MAKKAEEEPWWHEDTEPSTDDGPSEDATDDASDSSGRGLFDDQNELLNTAGQEALKLASTLSIWAEETGFANVIKGVAQQAVDGAQSMASSMTSNSKPSDESDSSDEDDVDLAGDEFAHLDDDPADGGLVYFEPEGIDDSGNEHDHGQRVSCDFCPVCRMIEAFDDIDPETAAQLAEMMAVITDTLGAAVANLTGDQSADDV